MDAFQNRQALAKLPTTQPLAQISPETQQIITLGEQKGWPFTLLGQAQLPNEPVHLDNWLIVPTSQDSSEIPLRTYRRIQTLFANGVRPQGFVVVHEAPKLLNSPPKNSASTFRPSRQNPEPASPVAQVMTSIVTTTLAGTVLLLLGTLFMGMALIDPIVVAVMEDGSWVEIDRWVTEA
jgi:hypothetical protein